jgi:dihydropteroate synthase
MISNDYGLDLSRTRIMGILNITPDSFSDGGKFLQLDNALAQAGEMEAAGAGIIDIGGESSRPGAPAVSETEELSRVLPVIQAIRRRRSAILLSIDTCKARVAEEALRLGANWINDISGMRFDPEMSEVVKKRDCPVVIMHMLGTPQTMQLNPCYHDVIAELHIFFSERIQFLNSLGIRKIILDPGIGFGKRLEDNLLILKKLETFKCYGYPLLVGTSRKSFIGTVTGRTVADRLSGTLATIAWSVARGVSIIRTHDVAEASDAIKLIDSIISAGST